MNLPLMIQFVRTIGVEEDAGCRTVIGRIERHPPLVVFRPVDTCNTTNTRRLMDVVPAYYDLLESFEGFEVYRSSAASVPAADP